MIKYPEDAEVVATGTSGGVDWVATLEHRPSFPTGLCLGIYTEHTGAACGISATKDFEASPKICATDLENRGWIVFGLVSEEVVEAEVVHTAEIEETDADLASIDSAQLDPGTQLLVAAVMGSALPHTLRLRTRAGNQSDHQI